MNKEVMFNEESLREEGINHTENLNIQDETSQQDNNAIENSQQNDTENISKDINTRENNGIQDEVNNNSFFESDSLQTKEKATEKNDGNTETTKAPVQNDFWSIFNLPAPAAVNKINDSSKKQKVKEIIVDGKEKDGQNKNNKTVKPAPPATKKIEPGLIIVKAYGAQVFDFELTEEKEENLVLDDVRSKVANEYDYPEFAKKEDTNIKYLSSSRIIVLSNRFDKKG